MKSTLVNCACALGLVSVVLAGCERKTEERKGEPSAAEQRREAEQKAIGGGPSEATSPSSALATIANARCLREAKCKHIGPNEKYKTTGDCLAEMQKEKRDDLNANDCPVVSGQELSKCVQAIRDEDCGNPLDAVTRLEACRSGSLCVKK